MSFSFFPLVSKCSSVALAVSLDTLLTQMLWAGEAGPSGGGADVAAGMCPLRTLFSKQAEDLSEEGLIDLSKDLRIGGAARAEGGGR